MPPEHVGPTWKDCTENQRTCAKGIYDKMDAQHKETLAELGAINKKLAYDNGRASAEHPSVKGRRFSWKELAGAVIIIGTAVFSLVMGLRAKALSKEDVAAVVKEVLKSTGPGGP